MTGQSQPLKELLLQTDEEYHQLAAKHQELERRLHELSAKPYLFEPEQLEKVTLKKRKLQLKDRMEEIIRRRRHENSTASSISPSVTPGPAGPAARSHARG